MSLNIWVIGSGAREDAIKTACEKSPLCKSAKILSEKELQTADLKILKPDLIIFGSEEPICSGLTDELRAKGIKCIGVSKKFSVLESSKLFAKKFMVMHNIKCAKLLKTESNDFPQVLKFDGLCKGKGVKVVYDNNEKNAFARKFSSMRYFIEEYLDGDEISVMSYFYENRLINFRPAKDFKKLSQDKTSPNTGGMGAYCPVCLTDEQQEKLNIYLQKLEKALINEGADFNGFIYSGLIWTRNDWYVLEYNVRLGDPECQAIITNLKNDFLDILLNGTEPEYKGGIGACLTIAAEGYPDNPITGDEITTDETAAREQNITIYNAGVKFENGKLYSNGGRVLSLCVNSDNPFPLLKNFANNNIKMQHKYFRRDIDIF